MTSNSAKLETKLAQTAQEFHAAQRLRYDVFVRELGGDGEGVDHTARCERDDFDKFADHLIVVDRNAQDKVVGVYRLMTSEMATRAGGFYSESEYDLTGLKSSGKPLLELGRSCVHQDYRGGAAIFQLWQGLAQYVERRGTEILFGVASFHGTEPAKYAHALSDLSHTYPADHGFRPVSRDHVAMDMLPPDDVDRARAVKEMPALIKSYLRLGGTVGDGAYIDHAFNTIDVCLLMDTTKLSSRHQRIFAKARRDEPV